MSLDSYSGCDHATVETLREVVWVCASCGKRASDLDKGGIDKFWDVSCLIYAKLCYVDSLGFNKRTGRVQKATAVSREDLAKYPAWPDDRLKATEPGTCEHCRQDLGGCICIGKSMPMTGPGKCPSEKEIQRAREK